MAAQHRSACYPSRSFKHKSVATNINLPLVCLFAVYRQSVGNQILQILCYLYQYYHFLEEFVRWIQSCIWSQMRTYSSCFSVVLSVWRKLGCLDRWRLFCVGVCVLVSVCLFGRMETVLCRSLCYSACFFIILSV